MELMHGNSVKEISLKAKTSATFKHALCDVFACTTAAELHVSDINLCIACLSHKKQTLDTMHLANVPLVTVILKELFHGLLNLN